MDVYLSGKKVRVNPASMLGQGGEAEVYDIGSGRALKIFKTANHPDYAGDAGAQQAARERLDTHQRKLRDFPLNLPLRVVTPEELATDRSGKQIVGYSMPLLTGADVLLRYSDRGFRQNGVASETVLKIFRDLHGTVLGLHKTGVVVGDFNDLNVLVEGEKAFMIDADSFQFGAFKCRVFTARFVDPLHCDPRLNSLSMNQPHSADSDWYAFNVMLMQCLLFVDPYGGVYRPADAKKRIPHEKRPLQRITVFDAEVRYPKPAVPYKVLPDELLQHFLQVFTKDQRGAFPHTLLENLRWTRCTACGTEHARPTCPNCAAAAPAAQKQLTRVRGNVTATRVFATDGVIVRASLHRGELVWLYHEGNQFKREDGTVVTSGKLDPRLRIRLQSKATLIGKGDLVATLIPGKPPEQLAVDTLQGAPVFDTNDSARYWVQDGQLKRDGVLGPDYIGDVLGGQTAFWVGEKFGFGFYRAGELNVAFVFDAQRRGIKDSLKLPFLRGHVLSTNCLFSLDRCWFFAAIQDGSRTVHHAAVIKADGSLEATATANAGDGSWLGTLSGKCAAGNFLLAATDDGLVRVETSGGAIMKTREFPDTEPFVDSGCHLYAGRRGLYVVEPRKITVLSIS
jgi:tRNA A-37 threonylcarbamoyl transferase component Bud32